MTDIDVDWSLVRRAPKPQRQKAREGRAAAERRTTVTMKQRQRMPAGEARNSQLNLRCSESFKERINAERARRGGMSIVDLLEMALERLEGEDMTS